MFGFEFDSVIFIILKEYLTEEMKKISLALFDNLDEEKEDKVYIFKKDINWDIDNNIIISFYKELANIDTDNFVFMRLGTDLEDYEILGDCICNFNKYIKSYDINIVRKFEFSQKAIERKEIARKYYIENVINKEELSKDFKVYDELEGIVEYFKIFNTDELDPDNLDYFEFNNNNYIVIKNIGN